MSLCKLRVFLFVNCIFIFRIANTFVASYTMKYSEIFFVIRKFLAYTPPPPPQLYMLATALKTAYNFSVSLILIPFFIILNFLNKKESKVICKREFEIILLQTQSLSIKPFNYKRLFSFIKNTLKRFAKRLWLNFVLN